MFKTLESPHILTFVLQFQIEVYQNVCNKLCHSHDLAVIKLHLATTYYTYNLDVLVTVCEMQI